MPRREVVPVPHPSGRWHVLFDWRERLLGPQSPDWFRLEDDPRATLIKQGRGRTVFRVDVGGTMIFAKVHALAGRASWLKAKVLGDPAQREWNALVAAGDRGVPTITALAVGRRADGRSALLTLGALPGKSFFKAWGRATGVQRLRRAQTMPLIRSAAALFATAHERGIWHRDGHAGNLLMQARGGEWDALFSDLLGAAVQRKPCARWMSLQSLAQFDQRMQGCATRTERLRFLREYLRVRGKKSEVGRTELRRLLREKQSAQRNHAARLAARWDRRLRGDGRYFTAVRLEGGWRGVVVLRLERPHRSAHPSVWDWTRDQWQKVLGDVVNAPPSGGALLATVLSWKQVTATTVLERLRWTMCGSPARKDFLAAHQRKHRDQPAPLLLGYLERRCGGMIGECILLHAIEGAREANVER